MKHSPFASPLSMPDLWRRYSGPRTDRGSRGRGYRHRATPTGTNQTGPRRTTGDLYLRPLQRGRGYSRRRHLAHPTSNPEPVLIQQQLGRGLRLAPNKEGCLVIDLVGRHNADFRFDRMLGLLSGLPGLNSKMRSNMASLSFPLAAISILTN